MAGGDLEEYTVFVHDSTDLAWLISESGREDDVVWVPKSETYLYATKKADQFRLEIPRWLAKKKGMF